MMSLCQPLFLENVMARVLISARSLYWKNFAMAPCVIVLYSVRNFVQSAARELAMAISSSDVIPLSQARAHLSELAEQVKAGAEKIITKNGESYVAIIDAQRLDYYHQLEREHIHLLLIEDASKGLSDVSAGKIKNARSALSAIKRRRGTKASG